jgi:hypothetical protein
MVARGKPPPPAIARVRKKEGYCWYLAGRAVDEDKTGRLVLVHGIFPFDSSQSAFRHAWVLDLADDKIFDTTQWRWWPASEYPGIGRVSYTQEMGRLLQTHRFKKKFPDWGPDPDVWGLDSGYATANDLWLVRRPRP